MKSCLIVDDSSVVRKVARRILEDIDYVVDEAEELARFEGTLQAIWKAIAAATLTGDFRPSPSKLCDWCSHQQLCPAKGGTPPPFPVDALAASTAERSPVTPPSAEVALDA